MGKFGSPRAPRNAQEAGNPVGANWACPCTDPFRAPRRARPTEVGFKNQSPRAPAFHPLGVGAEGQQRNSFGNMRNAPSRLGASLPSVTLRRTCSGAEKDFSTGQTKLWQELHGHDKDPMTAPTPQALGLRGPMTKSVGAVVPDRPKLLVAQWALHAA